MAATLEGTLGWSLLCVKWFLMSQLGLPSVQMPDLCSCLPSPREPVCWFELVCFSFFSKLFHISLVIWLSFQEPCPQDKGATVIATI